MHGDNCVLLTILEVDSAEDHAVGPDDTKPAIFFQNCIVGLRYLVIQDLISLDMILM